MQSYPVTQELCIQVCNASVWYNTTSTSVFNKLIFTDKMLIGVLSLQIILFMMGVVTFWVLNQVSITTEKLRRVPMPSIRGAQSHPLDSIKGSDRRTQAYSFVDEKQGKRDEEDDIMENVEFDGEVVYTTTKENQKKKAKDKRSVELSIQEETKGKLSESDEDDRVRIV